MTYTTINEKSRETAEALLVAAERVGASVYDVRTSIRGFIVPDAVAEEYYRMLEGDTEPIEIVDTEGSPDESWKVADIKAWAESHEVDLGGATKKADILAAIQAADTEEG